VAALISMHQTSISSARESVQRLRTSLSRTFTPTLSSTSVTTGAAGHEVENTPP